MPSMTEEQENQAINVRVFRDRRYAGTKYAYPTAAVANSIRLAWELPKPKLIPLMRDGDMDCYSDHHRRHIDSGYNYPGGWEFRVFANGGYQDHRIQPWYEAMQDMTFMVAGRRPRKIVCFLSARMAFRRIGYDLR